MTPDELIAEYRKQAIIYGEASESGDSRRGNKAQDKLLSIRRALRKAGPEQTRKLLLLLEDESPFVRLSAAIDAIEFSPRDAERVLSDIAAGPWVMAGFSAEMILKYWRKGEFTVPWWDD